MGHPFPTRTNACIPVSAPQEGLPVCASQMDKAGNTEALASLT